MTLPSLKTFFQSWEGVCAAAVGAATATAGLFHLLPRILSACRTAYSRLEAAATIGDSLARIEDGLCNVIQTNRAALDADATHTFFDTDPRGNQVWANARWHQITGLTQDEARGHGWENAIADEDRLRVFAEWKQAIEHEREFICDVTYADRIGRRTKLRVVAKPIRNGSGQIIGWFGVGGEINSFSNP